MNEASEAAKKQVQQALLLRAEICGVTIFHLFFLHDACGWRTVEDTLQSMSANVPEEGNHSSIHSLPCARHQISAVGSVLSRKGVGNVM